jgi:hypothetical protein
MTTRDASLPALRGVPDVVLGRLFWDASRIGCFKFPSWPAAPEGQAGDRPHSIAVISLKVFPLRTAMSVGSTT